MELGKLRCVTMKPTDVRTCVDMCLLMGFIRGLAYTQGTWKTVTRGEAREIGRYSKNNKHTAFTPHTRKRTRTHTRIHTHTPARWHRARRSARKTSEEVCVCVYVCVCVCVCVCVKEVRVFCSSFNTSEKTHSHTKDSTSTLPLPLTLPPTLAHTHMQGGAVFGGGFDYEIQEMEETHTYTQTVFWCVGNFFFLLLRQKKNWVEMCHKQRWRRRTHTHKQTYTQTVAHLHLHTHSQP